jgi:hypothetical protein
MSSTEPSFGKRNWPIHVAPLHQDGPERDWAGTTAAERVAAMWQLTLDAWAMKGEPVVEPRLQRHVVRIQRGGR